MKLKTSLQISAVFPVALAIIVTLSLFVRSRSLAESRYALEVSENALPMISAANAALFSYIGDPSEETEGAWVNAQSQLVDYCRANEGLDGVLGFLISEVRESAERAGRLAQRESKSSGKMHADLGEEMARLFSRGFKVMSFSRQYAESKEQASETAFLIFVAVFALVMTGSLFQASSRIMKRLAGMAQVCDKVRDGDMKQRIDLKCDDEIADFGRSFNAVVKKWDRELTRMGAELGEHRKGEETRDTATAAAREGNIRLADALTKLKRAQTELVQQERVRALEQVITGVARDFNDLLAPVLTMSDFLLEYPQKLDGRDDLKEDISVINSSARKALRQVRVLTDLFQSFEEPNAQKISLPDMVDEAEILIEKGSRHNLKAYRIEKAFNKVPFVAGNEVDYMEAIRDVMENALEAMDEGGKLKMTMEEKGKSVALTIKDDGVGMTDEVYKRALEPFFSTKGRGHSGMGLTFAVVAVGKFGGSLDVQSSEGQGTTVTLTVPVFDPKIHKVKSEESREILPKKLKILVIDDEEWTRIVLARSLGAEGHEVSTAAGGAEGLEKFGDGKFDVVLLDRAMPEMSGDDVAARILESGKGVPVVMLTGFGDLMLQKGVKVEGVDMILSKPVTIADLKSAIAKALRATKS